MQNRSARPERVLRFDMARQWRATPHSSCLIPNFCLDTPVLKSTVRSLNYWLLISSKPTTDALTLRCLSLAWIKLTCHMSASGTPHVSLWHRSYLTVTILTGNTMQSQMKSIQSISCILLELQMSRPQKPRSLTCYRVWPRHHEGSWCLWRVRNGSLRWVTWRVWWPWSTRRYVRVLLVCPGWGVCRCCCGTAGVFFGHRRAGVRPHALCQAMATAAS